MSKKFEKIHLKELMLDKADNIYLVYYDDNKDPIEIEANTAMEAVNKSGIKIPKKVTHIDAYLIQNTVINSPLKVKDDNQEKNKQ